MVCVLVQGMWCEGPTEQTGLSDAVVIQFAFRTTPTSS